MRLTGWLRPAVRCKQASPCSRGGDRCRSCQPVQGLGSGPSTPVWQGALQVAVASRKIRTSGPDAGPDIEGIETGSGGGDVPPGQVRTQALISIGARRHEHLTRLEVWPDSWAWSRKRKGHRTGMDHRYSGPASKDREAPGQVQASRPTSCLPVRIDVYGKCGRARVSPSLPHSRPEDLALDAGTASAPRP